MRLRFTILFGAPDSSHSQDGHRLHVVNDADPGGISEGDSLAVSGRGSPRWTRFLVPAEAQAPKCNVQWGDGVVRAVSIATVCGCNSIPGAMATSHKALNGRIKPRHRSGRHLMFPSRLVDEQGGRGLERVASFAVCVHPVAKWLVASAD